MHSHQSLGVIARRSRARAAGWPVVIVWGPRNPVIRPAFRYQQGSRTFGSDSLCESNQELMSFQELQQALYGTAAFSLRIDQNAGIVRRLKFKEIFSEIII
jgi:hypothetical protein